MVADLQSIQSRSETKLAKAINKFHGKSYYFATSFFPKDLREAMYVLYAFFRIPDEIVDSSGQNKILETKEKLFEWKHAMHEALRTGTSADPVLNATARIFRTYDVPHIYADHFIQAMILDTEKDRYETYSELEGYMHGSAVAVGMIASHVIGFKDGALPYARALGEAMQLTNFIRDIHEDFVTRGRIYLPQDELARFGVTDEIETMRLTPQFIDCLKFQIARARKLYREAEIGIDMLNVQGRLPVRLASRLYEAILDKVEEKNYDIFSQRASVTFAEKVWYTLPVLTQSLWMKK